MFNEFNFKIDHKTYTFNVQEGGEFMNDEEQESLREPDINFHDWIAKHKGK